MDKNEARENLDKAPSQEWLEELLKWIQDNPSDSTLELLWFNDREILDALLYSRGAKKRLDGVRDFAHNNENKLFKITSMIRLEPRDDVRKSVDRWIGLQDKNLIAWLLSPDRSGKEFLWERRDFAEGIRWLKMNQRDPMAPNLFGALVSYQPENSELRALARSWCLDNISTDKTDFVIERLLKNREACLSVDLAAKYVLHNLPSREANRILWLLVSRRLLSPKRRSQLISRWRQQEPSNRNHRILAELLKQNPSRRSLVALANQSILESHIDSSNLMMDILQMSGMKLLKKTIKSCVRDRLSSIEFAELEWDSFPDYIRPALTLASRYGDYEALDLVPKDFWIVDRCYPTFSPTLRYSEVQDHLKSHIEKYPDSTKSFEYQCQLATAGDQSAVEWLKEWLEEAVMPDQIIGGTDVILIAVPNDVWAIKKANDCIRNQLELGWGRTEDEIMMSLYAYRLRQVRAKQRRQTNSS